VRQTLAGHTPSPSSCSLLVQESAGACGTLKNAIRFLLTSPSLSPSREAERISIFPSSAREREETAPQKASRLNGAAAGRGLESHAPSQCECALFTPYSASWNLRARRRGRTEEELDVVNEPKLLGGEVGVHVVRGGRHQRRPAAVAVRCIPRVPRVERSY